LGASAEAQRQQQWAQTVAQAVEEWSVYLPLTPVSQADGADIIIKRESPPLGSYINPATGKLEIPRARTAQARYEIYQTDSQPPLLAQRMEVFLSPGLGESLLLATCRHELGHALGIWGHSDRESDALFFSQVRHSPSISPRDINTLIKVYQQPTRIGWPILNS
jgi:predicted Zn-dependent protease